MARRLSYSARHEVAPETVYSALKERQFWEDQMTEFRKLTPRSDIESFTVDDNGIDVVLIQTIPKTDLPAIAAAVIKKDLVITRKEFLGPFDATKTEGTYSAAIPAGPGNLTGVQELLPTETGCTLRRTSEVKVFIPFVNGKLEQLVLVHLVDLFRGEAEFTGDWIKAHG
ncbi:DUF2505 domain-containing protein [Williamsia sp. CHRR-6]|uniref:DUF2505 domain-containing protein n=1 Tax=Williamsia sp. CHRR-6 TaxID=2835871 RepID=UPI001BDB0577|nr:DUF2505 domain-containing protein [Williamsia sp. CHRR-6]MBT0566929.1 DUF2505 domain-containing protein [Williamsia sp. CHRR-6]